MKTRTLIPFWMIACATAATAQPIILQYDRTQPEQRYEAPRARESAANIAVTVLLAEPDSRVFRPVSLDDSFVEGQRFRLRVTPRTPGYLYVVCTSSQGETKLLYPNAALEPASRLRAGSAVTIPQRAWFEFDDQPGVEQVYLLVASQPVAELEDVVDNGGDVDPAALRRLERRGRVVVRDNPDGPPGGKGMRVTPGVPTVTAGLVMRKVELFHE